MTASQARALELAALLGVALALRLPMLGEFPGVAADEANWALLARAVSRGAWVRLPADAAFVTPLFAWLLAPMARGALAWDSLRLVPAALVSAGSVGVRVLGAPTLGVGGARVAALIIAAHPWSVLWSRTVSVPYALSLVIACVGPLALIEARRRGGTARAALAWQLVGVGVHFTPLALIPLVAGTGWALRARWRCVGAQALAWAHLAAVIPGVLSMPAVTRSSASTPLPEGALGAARMMLSHLSGVSSLRHFAGASLRWERVGALAVLLALASAVPRRREDAVRASGMYLALAAIALPLLLVPARAWSMPTVDADRYGFALLAPFALLLGALWDRATRPARGMVALVLLGCVTAPTAAMFRHALRGGGADLGLSVAGGGGRYRGWQRIAGGGALVDRAFDAVRLDAAGAPALVRYDDYALHAIRARTISAPEARIRHASGGALPRAGEREYRLLWRPEVFSPGFAPWGAAQRQREAWARARGMRAVATFRATDGSSLCALFADHPQVTR